MRNYSPIKIIADSREKRSGVIEHLESMANVALTVKALQLGDYEVGEQFVFERKRLTDLVISIVDGRLFRQVYFLSRQALSPVLILEGSSQEIAPFKMRRESIQGALIFISIGLGIPILRSLDAKETAGLMVYAGGKFSGESKGLKRHISKRPKTKKMTQVQILQGLPGVGQDRAKKLLEEFGSVAAVFSAGLEDLIRVPGVGDKTAKAIHWAIKEEISGYGEKNDLEGFDF